MKVNAGARNSEGTDGVSTNPLATLRRIVGMNTPTDLWQHILAAPADAALRAQFVAALSETHDARADLFTTQAEYDRLVAAKDAGGAAALKPRLDAALDGYRTPFDRRASTWPGRIAFVDAWPIELTIAARDFAAHAADVVATIPLRHLNLLRVADAPSVFDVPQLAQVVSIDASGQPWTDDAIRALARSARVAGLRWLKLSNAGITETQVDLLAASTALRDVAMLDLTHNPTRDPVDAAAGYGVDWSSNRIVPESIQLPAFGAELQAKYGSIAWLNGLWNYFEEYPPSRYTF